MHGSTTATRIVQKYHGLIAGLIIAVFVILQLFKHSPVTCWFSQFHNFYRSHVEYHQGFFPANNYALSRPASDVYMSAGPLVTWTTIAMARIFGDVPFTYRIVMIGISVMLFVVLVWFTTRRWGKTVALWTVFFAALSKLAFRFGDVQTFEIAALVGMMGSLFLYFEWIESRRDRFLVLSIGVYLVGLTAHYLAVFAACVICVHWLVFAKERRRGDWLRMTLYPIVTVLYMAFMLTMIRVDGYEISALVARATTRVWSSTWTEAFRALVEYPLVLLGPGLVGLAGGYLIATWSPRISRGVSSAPEGQGVVLECVLLVGLLPLLVFKNWFVVHRYSLFFLLPFFSIAGALGIVSLGRSGLRSWLKYGLMTVAVGSFLALTVQGAHVPLGGRVLVRNGLGLALRPPERTFDERVNSLSEVIAPFRRPGDNLLVLVGTDTTEVAGTCAFNALQVPAEIAHPSEWESKLRIGTQGLVLVVNANGLALAQRLIHSEVLARDGEIAYLRRK